MRKTLKKKKQKKEEKKKPKIIFLDKMTPKAIQLTETILKQLILGASGSIISVSKNGSYLELRKCHFYCRQNMS